MVRLVTLRYCFLVVLHYCAVNMTSAMFMTYLTRVGGLDDRWAMIAYAAYFLALTSVEIPTGAGSDVGGRKNAFVLASAFNAVSVIAYAFSGNFWAFAASAALGGIGAAFANGTLDSWFVTQLRRAGRPKESYDLIFTKVELFKCLVAGISGFIGIKFAGQTMQFPWFSAAVFYILTGIFAYMLMAEKDIAERAPVPLPQMWKMVKQTARDGVAYGRANHKIWFIVTTVAALYATVMIPNLLWQPHFLKWLPGVESLGYVWLGMMAANGFGVLVVMVPRLLGFEMYDRKTLLLCLVVAGIGIFGMALFRDLENSLTLFFIYQAGRGAFQPVNRAFLHRNIESEELRTTISSMEAIGHHVGAAVGLVIMANVVYFVSREVALMCAGAFLIVFAAYWWRRRKRC